MNPDLSMEQVWGFYSAISGGRFTSEQLDVLCDPTRPVAVMEAMRTGLTFGVDAQTVLRLADGSFAPEQMESLYLAAGDKDITPEMLDVIADASLKPEQMDALKISFQQGGSIADVEPRRSPCRVPSSTLGKRARLMPSVAPNSMRRPRNPARHPPSSAPRAMTIRPSSARSWSRMAYGDVKTKYGKGILKEYWDHIVSVAASCGKESEAAKDVSSSATLLSNMPM